ncbi:hypothetical protein LEP1GSC173_3451 [Leptospira interrogans str. HAI1594]|uniref:Uncharacterized protein n=3 Tax=Leptospira interrogans TaxID=173 RepID=M6KMU5_LEPIR|nr:hypothetical protein G436_4139 [Leptospira interrogans serovar Hardjo str. Norma]EJO77193.1 hypothetical protein LEP1GSC045_0974 [Leptospira interrogans serovar Pomona str. Kennewicki LC82-25]EJP02156.1 hypothetical protein LEP1GSC007_3575 [Leptospira interrogans serovar Bulgarica str. Mallika]EJP14241.1 hypothetical protein LEP1GSC080_4553 [Leptospira interrogans str. FPW2026]EKN96527.1 hypothetical protein LEP1GSC014_3747 [Leptospira interrogans serovar Pomona str. Pomona]EKO87000.1 hypot
MGTTALFLNLLLICQIVGTLALLKNSMSTRSFTKEKNLPLKM